MKKCIACILVLCSLSSVFAFASEYPDVQALVDDVEQYVSGDTTTDTVEDQQVVTYETSPTDEVGILSEIADTLATMEAGTLFNINSSQVEYFKGILLDSPFWDYCITFDGDYTYGLYYGSNLSVGDSCSYAYITRQSTGGYDYDYIVSTGGTSTVPSSGVYVSTIQDGMPILEEVENAKYQKMLTIGIIVALGLWVLSKVLFR